MSRVIDTTTVKKVLTELIAILELPDEHYVDAITEIVNTLVQIREFYEEGSDNNI